LLIAACCLLLTACHANRPAPTADHAYWAFNELIVMQKLFSLEEANTLIREAPSTTWSDGIRPAPLHPSILKRSQSGVKRGGKLRYTAHNMMKFALAR